MHDGVLVLAGTEVLNDYGDFLVFGAPGDAAQRRDGAVSWRPHWRRGTANLSPAAATPTGTGTSFALPRAFLIR